MSTATAAPPADATNAELIRWLFEILNTRDASALKELWSDATVERFPDRTCRGADEIAAYYESIFAAVPDFNMEVVNVAEAGDDVYVHWHLTGTHTGAPFQRIAATGRPIAVDGMDHFVVREGKVVSNFVIFDQMQFARQIGLMPDEGSVPDRALKRAFNLKTKLLARRRD